MKKTLLTLLLASLALTGCIVEPGGRGYRDGGRGEAHYDHRDHDGDRGGDRGHWSR